MSCLFRHLKWVSVTLLIVLTGLLSCVSRSLPDERFIQSQDLSAPTNGVVVADPENFTFSFAGDYHIAGADVSRANRILEASSAQGDAFHIALGDIVDKGEPADFAAFESAVNANGWQGKLFTAIGNHDIFYGGWQYYKQYFGASHYTFTVGNCTFVVFDTADGNVGETQRNWIENAINGANTKHVVLVSHYLPVIPGVQTYLRLANREEAVSLMQLASAKRVTAWLGGHYHSYLSETVDGVHYVVAGGAGGRRMDPVREFFYVQASVSGDEIRFERKPVD